MPLRGTRRRRASDNERLRSAQRRLAAVSRPVSSRRHVRGGWVPQVPAGVEPTAPPVGPDASAVLDRLPGGLSAGAASLSARVRGARFGMEQGHAVVVALLVLVGLAVAVLLLGLGRPRTEALGPAVSPTILATGTPLSSGPDIPHPSRGPQTTATTLVVHVAGKVRQPGVVRLPPGSRVLDAVAAAGGAQPGVDLTGVNLARQVADGEQVLVGVTPPAGTGAGTGAAGPDQAPDALMNLNTAGSEELEQLPGIGPALAGRILSWREQHGGFRSVDELQEVAGIGPVTFAEVRSLVTV